MKIDNTKDQFILALDIGNTTMSFALFQGDRIIARRSFQTSSSSKDDISFVLKHFRKICPSIDTCIVCSVVPQALKKHQKVLKKFFPGRLFVAGQDFKIPIKNCYHHPAQVGQDRLACAYAAKMQYGSPLIVIDFGTALTMDVVSGKGAYQGGMIVPGISLSLKALAEHTALLPQVVVQKPASLIGRNTQDSILSGIFYGYVCLIQGIVAKIKKELSLKPVVVLTGGYGHYMGKFLRSSVDHFDPDLVFNGLLLAFRSAQKQHV